MSACAGDDLAQDGAGDASPSAPADKGAVTISGQNWAEATLVASMYDQLLTAEGYDVTVTLVGTRDVYL
ncbi:MAG: glycine betaine ABC transporter substrate-binding protein, partial [Nocardioides sp.]